MCTQVCPTAPAAVSTIELECKRTQQGHTSNFDLAWALQHAIADHCHGMTKETSDSHLDLGAGREGQCLAVWCDLQSGGRCKGKISKTSTLCPFNNAAETAADTWIKMYAHQMQGQLQQVQMHGAQGERRMKQAAAGCWPYVL